jgi:hypothetical protein
MKSFIKVLFVLPVIALSYCTTKVDPTADIPVVPYSTDVSPIISANCASPSCHDGSGHLFPLLTYDDVMNYCSVKSGDAHGSGLYQVIKSYIPGTVMPPKPNDPLTDAQIGSIYVWILQGAKNN